MDAAEQLAVLTEMVAQIPARPAPRHPESGCLCAACTERDTWLEDKAASRAEPLWASGRDCDRAADRYYGDAA